MKENIVIRNGTVFNYLKSFKKREATMVVLLRKINKIKLWITKFYFVYIFFFQEKFL